MSSLTLIVVLTSRVYVLVDHVVYSWGRPTVLWQSGVGRLLGTQLLDGRDNLLLLWERRVSGGVVVGEGRDRGAERVQQVGRAVQRVSVDMGLTVGSGVPIGGQCMLGGSGGVADGLPQPRERQVRPFTDRREALGFLSGVGQLIELEAGRREPRLGCGIVDARFPSHADRLGETVRGTLRLAAPEQPFPAQCMESADDDAVATLARQLFRPRELPSVMRPRSS